MTCALLFSQPAMSAPPTGISSASAQKSNKMANFIAGGILLTTTVGLKELAEKAKPYFEERPNCKELYGTSDGNLFLSNADALNHKRAVETNNGRLNPLDKTVTNKIEVHKIERTDDVVEGRGIEIEWVEEKTPPGTGKDKTKPETGKEKPKPETGKEKTKPETGKDKAKPETGEDKSNEGSEGSDTK